MAESPSSGTEHQPNLQEQLAMLQDLLEQKQTCCAESAEPAEAQAATKQMRREDKDAKLKELRKQFTKIIEGDEERRHHMERATSTSG